MSITLEENYQLKKDICYLYHVQAQYKSLMPDLDCSKEFSLPYWVHLKEYTDTENQFYKYGCMLFILLLALDKIDGSGDNLSKVYESCIEAVQSVIPYSLNEERLKEFLLKVLTKSMNSEALSVQEEKELSWVYSEVVEGYFSRAL